MQRVHPLLTLENQIAKTVQTEKIEHRLFENGMVGLGLATSHNKEMKQVRGVDQTPYQSWHSPLRWATSYAHEVAPLLEIKWAKLRLEHLTKMSRAQVRSITSLQMFHTHTPHTLEKNWIIGVIRWELNPITCNQTRFPSLGSRFLA